MVFGWTELATGSRGEGDDAKGCVEKRLKVMGRTVDIASTIIFVQRGKRHERQGALEQKEYQDRQFWERRERTDVFSVVVPILRA